LSLPASRVWIMSVVKLLFLLVLLVLTSPFAHIGYHSSRIDEEAPNNIGTIYEKHSEITLYKAKGIEKSSIRTTTSDGGVINILVGNSSDIGLDYEIVQLNRTVLDASADNYKVYGYVGFYYDGEWVPLIGIKVEVWESDLSDALWYYHGCVYTDNEGFFEFEYSNYDGSLEGGVDIKLKFFLNNSDGSLVVVRFGDVYKASMIDDVPNLPSVTPVSLYYFENGTYGWVNASENKAVRYVFNRTNVEAAYIYDHLRKAREFLIDEGISPPSIRVEFADTYDLTRYDGNGLLNVSGNDSEADWRDPDVLWKEYAKRVLEVYSSYAPPYSSGIFEWEEHQNDTTAWIEGFGIFFQSLIKEHYGYLDVLGYLDRYNGAPKYKGVNVETQYDVDASRNDSDIIGAVAGILWDLYDNNSDDQDSDGIGDTVNMSFLEIWDVISTYDPWTIYDFIDGLLEMYTLNVTIIWELCWEHGVNIDNDPPSKPQILSHIPDTGVWSPQNWVWTNWSSCTDNISLMSHYRVYVKREDNTTYKVYTLNLSQLEINITIGSGTWYIYVAAVDRAGNENLSLVGKFMLDVISPRYMKGDPFNGTIMYDNKSGAIRIRVDWFDEPSGISVVYMRYKFGINGSWSSWINATYDGMRYYYVLINESIWKDPSVWGDRGYIELYWESYCEDYAGNNATTGVFVIKIVDDDADPPTIYFPPELNIMYDNSSGGYIVSVNLSDPSGIYNVCFEVIFEIGSIVYDNNSIMRNGSKYYVIIPWDIWIQYVPSKVYLRIYIWDNDTDRVGDRKYEETNIREIGELRDDDNSPPVVLNISYYEYDGSDNILECDERIVLVIYVNDTSGIQNKIVVSWGEDNITVNVTITQEGNRTYRLETTPFGPLPLVEGITITIWDNDSDRPDDYCSGETNVELSVVLEPLDIIVNITEIDMNHTSTYILNFTMERNDGGIVPIDNLTVEAKIVRSDIIFYSENITIHNASGAFRISPSEMNLSRGDYDIVLVFYGDEHFGYADRVIWLHVWALSNISLSVDNYVLYGQTVVISVHLKDETGEPIGPEEVLAYLITEEGKEELIGRNVTNVEGNVSIYWKVNVTTGNYTIKIVFPGSNSKRIYGSEASSRIHVDRSQLVINDSSPYNLVYSDGGSINISITDEFGNGAADVNASLYIYLGDELVFLGSNRSDANGTLLIVVSRYLTGDTILDLTPGNYTCLLVAQGDDRYLGEEKNITLHIMRDNLGAMYVEKNATYVEWGDKLELRIYVLDDDGEYVVNAVANVSFFISENITYRVINVEVADGLGVVTMDFSDLKPTLIINIRINVTSGLYDGSLFKLLRVYLVRKELYVEAYPLENSTWNVIYNVSSSITISIVDSKGKQPTGEGFVALYVDELLLANLSIGENIVLVYPFQGLNLMPNVYRIRLELTSDYYVLNQNSSISLVIMRRAVSMNVLDGKIIYANYSDNVSVTVFVEDFEGIPLVNSSIRVFIIVGNESEFMGHGVTNGSGYATISFVADLTPGNYTLRLEVSGPIIYSSAKREIVLIIDREQLDIKIGISGRREVGEEITIQVKIYDDEGNVVSGVTVGIFVDEELLTNSTCRGALSIVWIPNEGGSHMIVVKVFGAPYYVDVEESEKIEIASRRVTSGRWLMIILPAILIVGIVAVGLIIRKSKIGEYEELGVEEVVEEVGIGEEELEI